MRNVALRLAQNRRFVVSSFSDSVQPRWLSLFGPSRVWSESESELATNNMNVKGTVVFCRRRSGGVAAILLKVRNKLSLVDFCKCAVRDSRGLLNRSRISQFPMEVRTHH